VKTLIIVHSYHHNNTEKVARAMAEKLDAVVKYPQDVNAGELREYDLVGFGAGIDSGHHYAPVIDFVKALPAAAGRKAFIFSTSGISGKKKMLRDHRALRDALTAKGYCIEDEFNCAGLDTVGFLKYFGGFNKGRPNGEDLKKAADFAGKLIHD